MNHLIADSLGELAAVHGNRFEFHPTGAPIGRWSKDAIRRILENLCGIAVKYGAPNQPITVSLQVGPERIQLRVHNHGPAISIEDQAHLFEPFKRSRAAVATQKKGWGLGLSLVKGLAAAHGGIVRVESSQEGGTAFLVELPRNSAEEART